MIKVYDNPITIQKINEETETWDDVYYVHAYINKHRVTNESLDAGAIQSKRFLTFEIRYFKALEDIAYNTQIYRVLYDDRPFDIVDYDDYMERHRTVRLIGESMNV